MEQLKNENELEIFEKKNNLLQDLRNKLKEYFLLRDKFLFWEFTIKDDLEDHLGNYILFTIASLIFFSPLIVWSIFHNQFLLIFSISLTLAIGNSFLLRNFKIGYLKNRYKKFKNLKKEINSIVKEPSNIFSIILENEQYLTSLTERFSQNEEMKKVLKEKTSAILEEMKTELTNIDDTDSGLFNLNLIINKTQEHKDELLKFVNTYELNQKYLQYKKENAIVEDLVEKEQIEKNILLKFKSIL